MPLAARPCNHTDGGAARLSSAQFPCALRHILVAILGDPKAWASPTVWGALNYLADGLCPLHGFLNGESRAPPTLAPRPPRRDQSPPLSPPKPKRKRTADARRARPRAWRRYRVWPEQQEHLRALVLALQQRGRLLRRHGLRAPLLLLLLAEATDSGR